ncbi:hypothetical protein AA103196_2305 [Ameyamaea chiangmaiensis NBRC 103196]|nr:hypothetical protein AA103196_2305 [Ameyamaea chiangmaiensis NBRC 103196]
MTDRECRPPEGTEYRTYHWLRSNAGTVPCEWTHHGWLIWAIETTPQFAYLTGWRYVGPCVPPQDGEGE